MNALYYHFQVLTKEQADTLLLDFEPSFRLEAYRQWLGRYIAKANTFYQMQYANHRDYVFTQYLKHQGINEDQFEGNEEWQRFRSAYALDDHQAQLSAAVDTLREHQSWLGKPKTTTLGEALSNLESYLSSLHRGDFHPRGMIPVLDELWFDTVISNSAEEQRRIQWIAYDQYLQTEHWKRARAAMLLIHKARCSRPHGFLDDGAWGEEFTMHVHHKTYANRGNERYADLELLCIACHRSEHQEAS